MDIKELIFSCLQDDPKAQKQFYDLTCDKVMATCKRYSKDHEEARDFFQESYIRIFKNLNTFQIEKGIFWHGFIRLLGMWSLIS